MKNAMNKWASTFLQPADSGVKVHFHPENSLNILGSNMFFKSAKDISFLATPI